MAQERWRGINRAVFRIAFREENMIRRHFARPLSILALAGALAACQQAEQSAPDGQESVISGPEAKPGLSLDTGKLVLNAVDGRPAAAYFTLENRGAEAVELVSAHVEGAERTEMHETKGGTMAAIGSLTLAAGETAVFEPGGKHVMIFGLPTTITPGAPVEITLSFADGDKLSAPLQVEAAGAMGHGAAH